MSYTFIYFDKGEYKTWIIYLVMESEVWFSTQMDKECAYKKDVLYFVKEGKQISPSLE